MTSKAKILLAACLATAAIASRAQATGPLVAVEWGQDTAYAAACPVIDGLRAQPGCVAVAMAQTLTAFRLPAAPTGRVSYTTPTHALNIAADLSAPIDWDNAPDLIFRCGAAARTDYRQQNSTATVADMMRALTDNFGYDTDMALHSRECYTPEAWLALIRSEIAAGRPLITHARDTAYGTHAFIIDGIDQGGRVHVNWGWGGQHNGWYAADSLAPGPYHFAQEQRILTAAAPDDGRQTLPFRLEARLALSDTLIADGQTATVSATVTVSNRARRPFSGKYNITLIDHDGTRKTVAGNTYVADFHTNRSHSATLTLPTHLAPGTYTIAVSASLYGTSAFYPVAACGDTRLTVCSPTGLAAPKAAPKAAAAYNLSGQRVSPGARGLVIEKGRKRRNP